jgi:hypothetical protein
MRDFPEDLNRKVLSYVDQEDYCTVLNVRLVNKSWLLMVPFIATLETFSANRLAIPFIFERFVFEPGRNVSANNTTPTSDMLSNMYKIVYKFCTANGGRKGNMDTDKTERQQCIYDFAFETKRILLDIFSNAPPDLIAKFVSIGFMYVDRTYCARYNKPLLADRLYEAGEA